MSSRPRICATIFVLAAAIRLILVFAFHHYEIGRPEPVRIAIALATTGSFANPYVIPTGPTAHTGPIYPAMIAPFYAIWGDTERADYARFALNTLGAAAEYALLPLVAAALGLGLWPGILAGLGGALIPLHHWPECMGEFETTWTALFLEFATILFARFLRAPRLDWKRAAAGGMLWGGGILLAPNVLPVLIGFGVITAWKLRPRGAIAAGWVAVFVAGALLPLAPWLVRNYVQFGGLFLVRDDFPLELFVSNSDTASPHSMENIRSRLFVDSHPYFSIAASREIIRSGELAFEREKLRQALGWIERNPGKFAALTLARTRSFWLPWVPRFRWVFWTVAALGLVGLALLCVQARMAAAILGVIAFGYSAVYYVVQNTLRYQHPLWWIQVLLVGWMVHGILVRLGKGGDGKVGKGGDRRNVSHFFRENPVNVPSVPVLKIPS